MDGEWCFSPDDETITDAQGNINNIMDTRNYLNDNRNVIKDLTNYFLGQEQDSNQN